MSIFYYSIAIVLNLSYDKHMKFKQKSEGKKYLIKLVVTPLSCALLLASLWSCSSVKTKDRSGHEPIEEGQEIEEGNEVSLKEDRSHLEALRKEIPVETQKSNDELAYMLSLMKEGKQRPNSIRNKYQKVLRKKRKVFNKKMKKSRKIFTKNERKLRDNFLKQQKKEREEYKKKKFVDRDQRKEFYSSQDENRKEFFANERDKRKEYESEMRALSKDFNASHREKSKTFNEELRIYSKEYRDRKSMENKMKRLKKKQRRKRRLAPTKTPSEFDEMNQLPEEEL